MENNDDEDDNILEPLIKRRNQLAALVAYHRKNMSRASKELSPIADEKENLPFAELTKETTSEVNKTSQNEIVQTKHSISSDIIEDTDEETSLNERSRPKLTINSSSENESNTSLFSKNEIVDYYYQMSPVKIQPLDPNKTIKVLSTVIVKKPKYDLQSKETSNTTKEQQQQKNEISLTPVQVTTNQNRQLMQHVKKTITQEEKTCTEAHNDDSGLTSDTSLQQPAILLPTAAKYIDTSMIVYLEPENLEDISDAICCDSSQQLSNLPSIVAHSDDSGPTSDTSLQQPAMSLPTATKYTDTSMIIYLEPENVEDKSDATFCDSPQQPSNLPYIVAHNDDTSLQQPAISLLPTAAKFTDTSMIVYSEPENLEDKPDVTFCNSPRQPSNLHSTVNEICYTELTRPETHEDILNATRADTSFQLPATFDSNISECSADNNTGKIPKKRKRYNLSTKKAYIDFLSDEDKEDFSSGSSDLWSYNESELNNDDDIQNINKKKKKRKKKSDTINSVIKKKEKPINNRKVNKKLKEEGNVYENRKGETIPKKTMKCNPCTSGKCARGCYDISEERRTSLFEYYWNLDLQRRKDWIVRSAHRTPIKRRKTNNDFSRRNVTYEYFINDGEGHKQVCQKFLIHTLDITQKFIMYTLEHAREDMAQKDFRKPNVPKKYTEEAKMFTKNFIEKLPAVPSHYNRKKTNRTYLPQEMKNICNLYQMYLKYCTEQEQQALSENAFRTIFKEYNISFHIPKKDKCLTCVKAENNKDEMSDKDKELLESHHKEKKATYKRFKIHQTLNSPNKETVTCSFDLQKVLNTPHGQSMILYYSRKYSVFNFTIYESRTQDVNCYTWGECDGKRGSNEIATCLMKYLEEKDNMGVKHLLMYCDSCSGQNKNKTVLAVVNHFLKSAFNLEVIQINYLLPGHTYMPVDTVHAVIEREVRKIIVWSPSQWSTYFETARKRPRPYKVNVMEYSDFFNFDQLATNTFTPTTLKNIKFKNIRVATFKKKHNDKIFVKYSMEDDAETHSVTLCERTPGKGKGKGKGRSKGKKSQINNEPVIGIDAVQQLYNSRLPIAAAKYKDLINLCENGTIPKRFHTEYRALPCNSELRETLNETDEEDDEESEKENK